jgi:uncharacterized protein (TIGR04255 family)
MSSTVASHGEFTGPLDVAAIVDCGMGRQALAFVAKSGEHAIVEVVFGFQLSRPWHPTEIEKLAQSHDRWKDALPRLARHEMQQFMIGDGVQHAITLPGGPGISFERIKPNGDLAWRLRCEGNSIFVNCLEYTRWQEAWAIASGHMRSVLEVVGAEKVSIAGTLLQYIDVFDWIADPKDYDVSQLVNVGGDYVPRAARDYGLAWHLYQGWFEPVSEPVPGNCLHKAHFDALPIDEAGHPTVKLDTLLRSDFNGRISAQTFFEEDSALERMFVDMHDRNKGLLSSLLTKAICEQIGLEEKK